jgi:REP-associated tyrosine transposase
MAHSKSNILIHLVFSTKNRSAIIDDEIREQLNSYISGIIKRDGSFLISIGSVEDHIHILFVMSKDKTVTQSVRNIKSISSKWIKEQKGDYSDFQWQSGYGAFSVSQSNTSQIEKYIKNQKSHHKKMTFKEE